MMRIKRFAKRQPNRTSFVGVYGVLLILGVLFGDLVLGYLCVQAFLYHDRFYHDVWLLYGILTGVFLYLHLTVGLMIWGVYRKLSGAK